MKAGNFLLEQTLDKVSERRRRAAFLAERDAAYERNCYQRLTFTVKNGILIESRGHVPTQATYYR